VDVGQLVLDPVARADGRHGISLGHRRAAPDGERAQVEERDREAVGRLDGERPAVAGDAAGERDDPGRRRPDRRPGDRADVGASVESGEVRVVAELEWA
jgi:hypothetical protein